MADIAYLASSLGHDDDEIERRERVANGLVPAGDTVRIERPETGPESVESTVEEAWSAGVLLPLVAEHEAAYDALFVGCFGEPGVAAARELTSTPVVGSATPTFYTAAQLADRFSVLTILDSTVPMVHRQVHEAGLDDKVASVRVVEAPVLDIDHGSRSLVEDMIETGRAAVEADGAEALVPGCMSLSFMQVHDEIAEALGVPFLDPVRIGLWTASTWARLGLAQSRASYPPADRSKLSALLGDRPVEPRPGGSVPPS